LNEALASKKEQDEEVQELRLLLDTFREEMIRHVEQATNLEDELKEAKQTLSLTQRKLEMAEIEVFHFFFISFSRF